MSARTRRPSPIIVDFAVVIIITIPSADDFLIFILTLLIVLQITIELVPIFSVDVSGPTRVPLSGDWLNGLRPRSGTCHIPRSLR